MTYTRDCPMDDAIEDLHIELDRIKEQVRFYADLTGHENNRDTPIIMKSETFRIVMDELATRIEAVADRANALHRHRKNRKLHEISD